MSFIPKMVSASWRIKKEEEPEVKDEFKGKSPSEVLNEIKKEKKINLD